MIPFPASLQLYPNLRMVWSVFLQVLSQLTIDDNQCCADKEVLMESEETVSVSIIGITVYISWLLLFILLICILFFLGLTPCQRWFLTDNLLNVFSNYPVFVAAAAFSSKRKFLTLPWTLSIWQIQIGMDMNGHGYSVCHNHIDIFKAYFHTNRW